MAFKIIPVSQCHVYVILLLMGILDLKNKNSECSNCMMFMPDLIKIFSICAEL
jgi:hypothetical protein